ncbi:hypothetical protein QLX67_09760 [Balneolaceae bacterium ANBcel3]|nr:hypothetical protein [Balneolaceae bacterium ANBcel3]
MENQMDKEIQEYIEEAGLVFEKMGMTRMAGRVMGYLMVCDKDDVSFDELCDAIQVSRGSISMSTKQLEQVGFVKKIGLPGERKTFYRAADLSIIELLKQRIQLFSLFSDTLTRALDLKKRSDGMADWLVDTAAFYDWIGHEMVALLEKWDENKVNARNAFLDKRKASKE